MEHLSSHEKDGDAEKRRIAPPAFVHRFSIFDGVEENCAIRKSPFMGIYNLFVVFTLVYLVSMVTVSYCSNTIITKFIAPLYGRKAL